MPTSAPNHWLHAGSLSRFLLILGASVCAFQLWAAVSERPWTGVVQACTATAEAGFSAFPLGAEGDRHGLRCTVDLGPAGNARLIASATFDVRDPTVSALRAGAAVDLMGVQLGPWAQFRPKGYARNTGPLQGGLVVLALGLALRVWRKRQ
ncbi:hypothetical protein [Limnohabitans sp.]|uniref:hypothetical protein n=1 Tax=Limnohabitans sp. TaxID=1907725 RepID=UPI0035B490BB